MKKLISILALSLGLSGVAQAQETVTFGYLSDPSHEAILWAINNGKVTSDTIKIEATALEIPALIQATVARTYDVIETAAIAVPRARGRGLDLRIIGTGLRSHGSGEGGSIWVPADSPIKTVEDLKGKKLAVYSLGSAGITLVRIALAESHGMDVATKGGDIELVEMPAPGMPAALSAGNVDAATLIHAQVFQASKTGDYRPVGQLSKDLLDNFGVRMVSAVLAGYGDKLEADPTLYQEFSRVLRASLDYALANPDEVFTAVGKEYNIDPAFFEAWFERYSEFPVLLSKDDMKAAEILWEKSMELGLLESYPPIEEAVWSDAVMSEK